MDFDMNAFGEMIREQTEMNNGYLETFTEWLEDKGLSEKTIRDHVLNVRAFLNDYVNYFENATMIEGMELVEEYLGDWFIARCHGATTAKIKTTAVSIKKFYKCMTEDGEVPEEAYREMCRVIKGGLEDWMEK